ncbi:MAG: hypothetical protein U0X39_12235 [Bacteroidales bacterium]
MHLFPDGKLFFQGGNSRFVAGIARSKFRFAGCCNPSCISLVSSDGSFVMIREGVDKIKVFDPIASFTRGEQQVLSMARSTKVSDNRNLVRDIAVGDAGADLHIKMHLTISVFRKKMLK